MTHKERVDRVLAGGETDRPPFTFWHHFHLEDQPPERFAEATVQFHRKFRTDLIKVMSDFPYPKGPSRLRGLKVEENPFPAQVRALEIIRDAAGPDAYFVETIFNPYNQAQKMTSKSEVRRLRTEEPQALLDALEVIAKSEANHARRAVATGASGIFLAIDNHPQLTPDEYAKFSEPFDRMVLDTVRDAPLNVVHLHGERIYIDRYYQGWPAAVLNYSVHTTGIPLADVRRRFPGVLMGGVDEIEFRKLTEEQMRSQSQAAAQSAGRKYILAPGCSVPDETPDDEMLRFVRAAGAS